MEGNLVKSTDPPLKLKRGKSPIYKVIKIMSLEFEFTSKSEIKNRPK